MTVPSLQLRQFTSVTTYDFVNSKSCQWPALRRSEDGTLRIGNWVICQ